MLYLAVKNGFPGADVWETIYRTDLGFQRYQWASGNAPSGEITMFSGTDFNAFSGMSYYLRCETFVTVQGTSYKISDTEAQVGPSNSSDQPDYATLFPGSPPTQTYIERGKYATEQPMGTIDLGLSTGTNYIIQAGLSVVNGNNTPAGYLSVDLYNPNRCVIQARSSLDDTPGSIIIWLKQDTPNGFLLTNQSTNTILFSHRPNGSRVQLIESTPLNQLMSLWTNGNSKYPTDVALRVSRDDNQYLNVFGDGPWENGSPVGTLGWGGGGRNEVWTFTPV